MFVLKNQQIEVYKEIALKNFEDKMLNHIKEFFPNHFNMIPEDCIREIIQLGYEKAKGYGFTTQRNVCLYINIMLVVGSNFDVDPMYSWVSTHLVDSGDYPNVRMNRLSDESFKMLEKYTGSNNQFLNRALLKLNNSGEELFQKLKESDLNTFGETLKDIYPEKYDVIDYSNLLKVKRQGIIKANSHGIFSESNILVYLILMFLLGSEFDHDPQFNWVQKTLNDSTFNEDERIKELYRSMMDNLRSYLFKNNS